MTDIITINQVKQHNVSLVINALKANDTGTKTDIARTTGLSVATCNTILNELFEEGRILQVQSDGPTIGRPPKLFQYNADFSHICCLYFANDRDRIRLHYAVTNLRGEFLTEGSAFFTEFAFSDIIRCITDLRNKFPKISTISIGVPGYYQNGRLCSSGRTILDGCDIVGELETAFPCKVFVENDMNAMAYGIYYYRDDIVSRDENITLISLMKKNSLGSGTIIDGKILHGQTFYAGEVLNLNYPEGSAKELLTRHDGIIAVTSRLVIVFGVIINPAVIVFTGDNISSDDIAEITENAGKFVTPENMPRIIYKSNFQKYYLQGLSAIALNSYGN